jgi:hypothetical protein
MLDRFNDTFLSIARSRADPFTATETGISLQHPPHPTNPTNQSASLRQKDSRPVQSSTRIFKTSIKYVSMYVHVIQLKSNWQKKSNWQVDTYVPFCTT